MQGATARHHAVQSVTVWNKVHLQEGSTVISDNSSGRVRRDHLLKHTEGCSHHAHSCFPSEWILSSHIEVMFLLLSGLTTLLCCQWPQLICLVLDACTPKRRRHRRQGPPATAKALVA
jgi:hypothetical protein